MKVNSVSKRVLFGLEWFLILSALASFTLTESMRPVVLYGLITLFFSWIVRYVRAGRLFAPSKMTLPWGLFVFSAGAATWIAYDTGPALLQFARILAAGTLFFALLESEERFAWICAAGFMLAASVLAFYWPLQHDFWAQPIKFPFATGIGLWLQEHLPQFPGPSIHPNVGAGVLALALPFGLALFVFTWRAKNSLLAALWGVCIAVVFFGLLLTGSRGALIGLAVAAILALAVFLWRKLSASQRSGRSKQILSLGTLLLVAAVFIGGTWYALPAFLSDTYAAGPERIQMWRQGAGLIRDYFFTGSGLMTTPMVHGVYGILIDTPFLDHLHNTYLEIWLEQGLVGFLALVAGGFVVLSRAFQVLQDSTGKLSKRILLNWAGLAALTIIGVHSLFDVVFYVERTLPVIGFVAGFAFLPANTLELDNSVAQTTNNGPQFIQRLLIGFLAIALLVLGALFHRALLASWYANLGALGQTRLELGLFDPAHFETLTIDQIRRRSDMIGFEANFQKALAWNANNLTALQRTTEIAMSRGAYAGALASIQSAWLEGNQDEKTRLLLGDAWVAAGNPPEAAAHLHGLDWAVTRLFSQAYYRYWLDEDYARAALAYQTILLLDPANTEAAYWLEQAETRLR
jgi:O-antigen ligase